MALVFNWIKIWLTDRTQRTLINGESSTLVTVSSGVPQGTIIGPLKSLLYYISMTILETLAKIICDDGLLDRLIDSHSDTIILQQDL